jgi:glucuronoarabinoxylan endo-1,4-beta-xylanase
MNFKRLVLVLGVVVIALAIALSWGCEKSQPTSPQLEGINQPGVKTRQECSVNLNSQMQYIDGFGASTAWHGQISDAEANASFSNGNNQLGLTILRIRIDPGESWGDELANAQKARARGAKILATPWTPPSSMKTNGSAVGGELKTSDYGNYASWLNSFRSYMSSNGAAVDVISIQNEPNITVDYESCDWSPTQLLNFCRDYAQNIGGDVMMPEAYNFDVSYSDPTLNNSTAASHISHIGGHLYGANPFRYSNAINKGKSVWMTEIYFDGDDIGTALTFGKEILDCMANDMNAYVYWYLRQPNCNLINSGGSINKKGYVMGQFSKFIRSGYHRVDATYNPTSGIYVTAFTGSGNAVIVAINQNGSSSSITLSFSGNTVSNITKWETSNSNNLREIGTYSGGSSLTNSLAGNSISTFVGTIGGGSITTSTTTTTTSGGYTSTTTTTSGGGSNSIVVRARGTGGGEHIYVTVGGSQIGNFNLTTSYQNYSASTNNTGDINVCFDNDDGENMDVQIDYITVNGSTRQAEDQSYNTGVWQNNECGGGDGMSEWLHCEGCIGFGSVSGGGGSSTTTTTSGGYTTTTTSGGSGGTRYISSTIRVDGGTYDGGGERIIAQGMGDGSQDEDQDPIFRLENATLRNVRIGAPGCDGVHCYGNCRVENVTWEDVGEDALTVKGEGNVTVSGGSARDATDKIFQLNQPCTFTVENFSATNFGCFIRQNGGTSFRCTIYLNGVTISNGDYGVRTDADATQIYYRNFTTNNVDHRWRVPNESSQVHTY